MTSQKAIDELLENDCFGHDTVVVVRERWKDQYQMHLDEACSGIGFREYLESRGVKIIRISKEDADHYANNYLTVDARHIMSVAGQSKSLEADYAKCGVQVEWIPLDNLMGGYGAAHCMTQVLSRAPCTNRE